jgi:hypothetical protein
MTTAAANDARIMVARFPEIFANSVGVVDTTPGLNARHCGDNRQPRRKALFSPLDPVTFKTANKYRALH